MGERDFEVLGRKFKLSKINALKQFHIVRRVGPILSDLLPAVKGIGKKDLTNLSQEEQLEFIAGLAGPIMSGLSKLSDSDSEMVLYGLLSSVEMQQSTGNWARVSTDSMLLIQDMELPVLLNLAGRAFAFNLSGFFAALPQ